jgi:hypothetical protein
MLNKQKKKTHEHWLKHKLKNHVKNIYKNVLIKRNKKKRKEWSQTLLGLVS